MNPHVNNRPNTPLKTLSSIRPFQRFLSACAHATGILLSALLITPALAQPVSITPVSEWPGFQRGPAQAVAVAGGYAYVAAGGVYIFDTSQLSDLAPVGIYATPDARDVVVIGQYAYVADWDDGLRIIDVSEPVTPRAVGHSPINGHARRLAVVGKYAYLAADPLWDGIINQGGGLQVVDVSDPTNPRLVGEYGYINPPCGQCGGAARDVAIQGNYAFLAEYWDETLSGYGSLAVIDISDPTFPWLVASYDTSSTAAVSVTISGNLAYVGNYNSLEELLILDISNPTAPLRVGGYSLDGDEPHVTVSGNYAYLAMRYGLESVAILDISNPAQPVRVSGIKLAPDSSATGSSAVEGDKLYVAGRAGLFVFDVAQPENPLLLGDYNTSIHGARQVAISGRHAHLVDGYVGLHIFDITNSDQPVRLGTYRTQDYATDVDISGHFAYLTESMTLWDSGQDLYRLQVIDVSNPAVPERVGGIDLGPSGGWGQTVTLSGGYAYVAGNVWELSQSASGLHIIDVRDPRNPTRVGTYISTWGISGIAISGSHAYLTTYDRVAGRDGRRTEIVDVTDPVNPKLVGTIDDPGGVAIQGTRAYLASASYDTVTGQHGGALRVFDVSDPSAPTLLGECSTSGPVYYVTVAYGYAWLVGRLGLEGVDVSNPQSLSAALLWEPPNPAEWNPQQVRVSDHHVFIAGGYRTLHILRIDGLPEEVPLQAQAAGDKLRLTWPSSATGFELESSARLGSTTWDPVPGTPQLNGSEFDIVVPVDAPSRFFRLRKP